MIRYLLDANVFIQAKNQHYGLDFCPAFWDWLIYANTKGVIHSIEKVKEELTVGDDALATWAKSLNEEFFLPIDDSITQAMSAVSRWVDQKYKMGQKTTFLRLPIITLFPTPLHIALQLSPMKNSRPRLLRSKSLTFAES